MSSGQLEVLRQSLAWLAQGKSIWLCSIVATYGSAPRPQGALFATDGSRRSGSISGGCIEDAFVAMLARGEHDSPLSLLDYGSHLAPDGSEFELPCGGRIRLLVERLSGDEAVADLNEWLSRLQGALPFVREVRLEQGVRSYLADEMQGQCEQEDPDRVQLSYAQRWRLLLLGISQVSEQVARLGQAAGFEVLLCDTREAYRPDWHWGPEQGGIAVEWCDPERFVERHVTARSAVLALAHDPRIDDAGLMAALESEAFYLGAMGSVRTSERRLERLQRIGEISRERLDRIHAPIGLPIGSKAPIEIAIATLAEVIAARHGIRLRLRQDAA
ncbi:XdhC family protein [Aeromonas encheleia]|uniref:XdhC family protein n=1 Tax=Aeromonas encheleia TaxID=73010 RepID=UPI001F5A59A9|nr:XdhC family protein [Aeromonas encheleia]UNP87468.1 XdhC family protein [Aeromonas encheleia]